MDTVKSYLSPCLLAMIRYFRQNRHELQGTVCIPHQGASNIISAYIFLKIMGFIQHHNAAIDSYNYSATRTEPDFNDCDINKKFQIDSCIEFTACCKFQVIIKE